MPKGFRVKWRSGQGFDDGTPFTDGSCNEMFRVNEMLSF